MKAPSIPPAVRRRTPLLVFAAALAIRVAALVLHPPADDGDQALYRTLASGIAGGGGYLDPDGGPETTVHPLLPVLVSIPMRILGDDRTAERVVTILVGSFLPALAAWCIGGTFGSLAGWLAGALLGLQPHHVLASTRLEPDLLAATLGFALSAALVRGRWGWAGVAAGLAYLNRPEAILWLPAAALFARWRGASLRGLGAMVLAAAPLVVPFALYIHAVEGRWAVSGKDRWVYLLGVHQYRSGGQPLDPSRIPALRDDVGSATEHLASRPGEFFRGYAYRSWVLFRNLARQAGWGVLLPLAVAGIVVGLRRSRQAAVSLLVPLVTLPVLPLVGTFFRHAEVPAAVLLAFAAVGAARLVGSIADDSEGRLPAPR